MIDKLIKQLAEKQDRHLRAATYSILGMLLTVFIRAIIWGRSDPFYVALAGIVSFFWHIMRAESIGYKIRKIERLQIIYGKNEYRVSEVQSSHD